MTAPRTMRPGEALPLAELAPAAVDGFAVSLAAAGSTPELVAMLVGPGGKSEATTTWCSTTTR